MPACIFCLLAGADIEQAEDEEALDYEHEAPRSTCFADLADDSSDDTDDDERASYFYLSVVMLTFSMRLPQMR